MPNWSEQERKERVRGLTRIHQRGLLMHWYLANNGGKPPVIQCEDKKPYGKIIYWLEPTIPEIENYRLVEYSIGDGYAFAIEELPT